MENFLLHNGLPALFLLSFMAATVIPLGSEWLLIALTMKGFNVANLVAVATLGNYLGACTTYLVGLFGAAYLLKILRMDQKMIKRAESFYRKYGVWSLLFSWLPVIGDPLCFVGGVLKLNFPLFSLLVFTGKLARYSAVAALTTASLQ